MSSVSARPCAYGQLLGSLEEELRGLEDRRLFRRLKTLEAIDGPVVTIEGTRLVNWCSNDYLGLSTHPALTEAAARAARDWGVGARASRLLAGTARWHTELEAALADWFRTESAIVFPSGYLANLGTLGALAGVQDVVLVDRRAHASLIDAARATRAALRVFRHNDPEHVAHLLERLPKARRRFIVTEGLFSMDGDRAPLAELLEVAEAYHAVLYVDDAHGAFVLGAAGRGSPEAGGLSIDRFLYMGTLGKALGCQGGFVAGSRSLIEFLRNRSRPFIYTTALAVPIAAAAVRALELVRDEPQRRQMLQMRAERLHAQLSACGLVAGEPSHIIPVVVGETARTLELAEALWTRGIWASAIRPPTVPPGTARLRLSVTTLHTEAQIDALVTALREALARN
jgi:8-amino-7-oxononanoate synthase